MLRCPVNALWRRSSAGTCRDSPEPIAVESPERRSCFSTLEMISAISSPWSVICMITALLWSIHSPTLVSIDFSLADEWLPVPQGLDHAGRFSFPQFRLPVDYFRQRKDAKCWRETRKPIDRMQTPSVPAANRTHLLQKFYAEAADGEREQTEARDRDEDAGQQCWPETEAWKQCRKGKEHGQRRHDIPERIPGMVRDFRLGLLFHIEPDQCQHRHQRQRSYKTAELVAALCEFRDQHDNCGRQKIFCDDPGHVHSLLRKARPLEPVADAVHWAHVAPPRANQRWKKSNDPGPHRSHRIGSHQHISQSHQAGCCDVGP